jgi:hypothetical protein
MERIVLGGSLAAIRHWLEAGLAGGHPESRARRRRSGPRRTTGSQERGFCAAGAQYYTWQEERADAEAWAASLAPLDDTARGADS